MSNSQENRNVLLGITGSVAAYKAPEIARLLIQRGYKVQAVMTKAACEFITPVTMEAVTGNPAVSDFFSRDESIGTGHIRIADWADVFLIAPATAHSLSKLALGQADCPVSSVALATAAPILVAPAMNMNMFVHPATQQNIATLKSRGVHFVEPEEGDLACGWNGTGRLASPWEIFHNVRRVLADRDFEGKYVVITTGPTREMIDPVRFLSNRSSGKMGVALAREAYRRGARVKLIHGPVHVKVPRDIECVSVVSAQEMREAVMQVAFEAEEKPDIVIMAAAVADFRPKSSQIEKIKKENAPKSIELAANADILAELGERRKDKKPALVGFAVETGEIEDLIGFVRQKLEKKSADIIVGNFAQDAFDLDTNRVWIIDRHGRQEEVSTTYKSRVANKILDTVRRV
ncbi:MAG: bifunctional phosphopantothenoylcysteine decarboxylase/phosphopantothenate--cysteine ligase CoaBC [Bdellovibrionales bacterium]|nr:bifunctional phosphopantothenoylcysteine decarboxylase/phosphopantothenate--cysteine ligase CoaBC [Bdellovibrionales bacterium]